MVVIVLTPPLQRSKNVCGPPPTGPIASCWSSFRDRMGAIVKRTWASKLGSQIGLPDTQTAADATALDAVRVHANAVEAKKKQKQT